MKIIVNKENKVLFLLPDNAVVETTATGTNIKKTDLVKIKEPQEDKTFLEVEKSVDSNIFVKQLDLSNSKVIENVTVPSDKFYGGKYTYANGKFSVVSGWKDPA